MNGSENGYAGAMFFALMSLGAIFKLDDVIGLVVGAAGAIFAAISLRRALVKAAQAAEEDHQRMEIQLQQLRSKIMETSAASVEAMSSVSEAMSSITETAHLLQDNLQVIRVRLAELDNLTPLAKSAEEIHAQLVALDNLTPLAKSNEEILAQLAGLETIRAQLDALNHLTPITKNAATINEAVASLEENSFALNAELEKIVAALQSHEQAPTVLVDELRKLNDVERANAENIQTVLKLLQVIGQMLKTPSYAKDFDALKTSIDAAHRELSELVRINGGLSKNFSTTIDDLRIDVARLTAHRETTRKTPQIEEPPILNEHDITMLKKIVAKINIK